MLEYRVFIGTYGNGTTNPSPGSVVVPSGVALTIQAIPGDGTYPTRLWFWMVNGVVVSKSSAITVKDACRVEANFYTEGWTPGIEPPIAPPDEIDQTPFVPPGGGGGSKIIWAIGLFAIAIAIFIIASGKGKGK